jgi:hypothetical protein
MVGLAKANHELDAVFKNEDGKTISVFDLEKQA